GIDRAAELGSDALAERGLRPEAVRAHLGAREAGGAHALRELLELVGLGAREVRARGDDECLDDLGRQIAPVCAAPELLRDGLPERYAAAAVLDDEIGEVDVLHVEAQIRLVVAVLAHRLVVTHPRKAALGVLRREIEAGGLPDREDEPLDEREDVVLVHEAELDVDLRELGLAIEPEILVAEAAHDLEVLFEPRHHEELLEELRALGEGVELARMQAGGDEEVARAARRVLHEEGRLDLEAALTAQIAARRLI